MPLQNDEKQQSISEARQLIAENLCDAITAGYKNQGFWLNCSGKSAPSTYGQGASITPFSALALAAYAESKGFTTNVFSTYYDLSKKNLNVKAGETFFPMMHYSWTDYKNRDNGSVIPKSEYDSLPEADKTRYKRVREASVRKMFNMDQTTIDAKDANAYAAMLEAHGPNPDKGWSYNPDAASRNSFNRFFRTIQSNLGIKVMKTAAIGPSRYIEHQDALLLAPQVRYPNYCAFLQDTFRALLYATGSRDRQSRFSGQDEALKIELASAALMQRWGLPAVLSANAKKEVEKSLARLLRGDLTVSGLEADINNAIWMIDKAASGEKIRKNKQRDSQDTEFMQTKTRQITDEAVLGMRQIRHVNSRIGFEYKPIDESCAKYISKCMCDPELNINDELAKASDLCKQWAETKDFRSKIELWRAYKEITDKIDYAISVAEYDPMDESFEQRVGDGFRLSQSVRNAANSTNAYCIVLNKANNSVDVVAPTSIYRPAKSTSDAAISMASEDMLMEADMLVAMDPTARFDDSMNAIKEAVKNTYKADDVRIFSTAEEHDYEPSDKYFVGKEAKIVKLTSAGLIEELSSFNLNEAQAGIAREDYMAPAVLKNEDGKGYSVVIRHKDKPTIAYPMEKEDQNRFFTLLKARPPKNATGEEKASFVKEFDHYKWATLLPLYVKKAQADPAHVVNLVPPPLDWEAAKLLDNAFLIRSENIEYFLGATINGIEQPYRQLSAYENSVLSLLRPDEEVAYKEALAVRMFRTELENAYRDIQLRPDLPVNEKTRIDSKERMIELAPEQDCLKESIDKIILVDLPFANDELETALTNEDAETIYNCIERRSVLLGSLDALEQLQVTASETLEQSTQLKV